MNYFRLYIMKKIRYLIIRMYNLDKNNVANYVKNLLRNDAFIYSIHQYINFFLSKK